MLNQKKISQELRQSFSGSEGFMNGHQIVSPNHSGGSPRRNDSEWAKSDRRVKQLLLLAFPKLLKHPIHTQRAAQWARIIHLYFRQGLSYGAVAEEMQITKKRVRDVLQCIYRVQKGLPANGAKKSRKRSASKTVVGG
ncbi:MAG: hypothetical protein ACREQ5_26500 [Candidatus Dormibacteria bacterium]